MQGSEPYNLSTASCSFNSLSASAHSDTQEITRVQRNGSIFSMSNETNAFIASPGHSWFRMLLIIFRISEKAFPDQVTVLSLNPNHIYTRRSYQSLSSIMTWIWKSTLQTLYTPRSSWPGPIQVYQRIPFREDYTVLHQTSRVILKSAVNLRIKSLVWRFNINFKFTFDICILRYSSES